MDVIVGLACAASRPIAFCGWPRILGPRPQAVVLCRFAARTMVSSTAWKGGWHAEGGILVSRRYAYYAAIVSLLVQGSDRVPVRLLATALLSRVIGFFGAFCLATGE